uniref:Hint domain-containing protein n=1 Tax=Panagrolaimus superbus TaxID=310955 RepID=A0A914ZE91_9BILA
MKEFYSFTNETAECEDDFSSSKCMGDGEWVGGIKEQNDIGSDEILFRCCYHSKAKTAKFLTVYDIKINEKFEGGEVFDDDTGEQLFFDYINNIVKFVTDKGLINYEIFVNRLPCIPLQKSFKKMIESNATIYSNNIKESSRIDTTKLFQAPTFVAAGEFLPIVDGGSSIPMQSAIPPPPSFMQNNAFANVNNDLQIPQNPQLQSPIQNNLQVTPINNNNAFQVAPLQSFQPMNNFVSFIPNSNPSVPVPSSGQASYPYPYYNYYPVETANPLLRFLCFSGDTIITALNGQEKRLDQLEINEWILSSGENVAVGYSKVNAWIHRMPKVEAEFIKFILEDGKELKITNKHFMYRGDCSRKFFYPH